MSPAGEAVVYVDDEPAICRVVRLRLEAAGIAVQTFTDPCEAVDWISGNGARCVLCDQRMPDLSGLDVHERLDPAIPFWLVTGDLSIADDIDGHPEVRGVLRKPIDFDAMLSLVASIPLPGAAKS